MRVSVVAVVAVLIPAPAWAAPGGPDPVAAMEQSARAGWQNPGVDEALRRDRGWSPAQARTRLTWEARQPAVEHRLRTALGAGFGGAWLSSDGRLVVGVTGEDGARAVRAAGAVARPVAVPLDVLQGRKAALDRAGQRVPETVSSWYVDVAANTVVIDTQPGGTADAERFAAAGGVPVRVREVAGRPVTVSYLGGGDRFASGGSGCSTGFTVHNGLGLRGFVTAGHCRPDGGPPEVTQDGRPLGTWERVTYPVADMALVRTTPDWTLTPRVDGRYPGNPLGYVNGSQEASIGATVCRTGITTPVSCGTVLAKDVTSRYPRGTVNGLTMTDACAARGDSGGPVIAGDQAQGVMSGINHDGCDDDFRSFFQPVNPILSGYGLTLNTFWQGWAPAPGGTATTDGPAVISYGASEYLFTRTTQGTVGYSVRAAAGTWGGTVPVPGNPGAADKPALAVYGGRLHVFVRDASQHLQTASYNDQAWSDWAPVPGGTTPSAPAAAVHDGRLRLIVRTGGDGLAENVLTGTTWSGWSPLPGTGSTPDAPAVTEYAGVLYLAVHATDGRIYTNALTTSWGGWQAVPGNGYTMSPLALSNFDNVVRMFARGGNNKVYMNTNDNGWSGWAEVPGMLTGNGPAAGWTSDGLHLFVRGLDGSLSTDTARMYS